MSELTAVLKGVVLFQDLTDQDLNEIAQRITRRTFKLGEYLFRAGAARTELMIIQTGEVEIFQGVGDIQKTVARLGEGNFVGEAAMLGDEPHGTSCRAVVDTTVLALERRAIDEIFGRSPDAARKMLSQVARVMAYRLAYSSYCHLGAAVPALLGGRHRPEHDLLGERLVPADAYYGIQTLRAVENYDITGIPLAHYPRFIMALAMVKKACARANSKLGDLEKEIADAISAACDELIAGNLHNQFVVDMIQGGAGTSTNMNANTMLTQAINTLTQRCIKGITANRERCRQLVEHSMGLVTALNPYIGYENSTRIAKKALDTNRSVAELVLEEKLLTREQLEEILKPERMTAPRV